MIYKIIKDFFLKRKIKKSIQDYSLALPPEKIKTIGILFDATYFNKKDALISNLIEKGIDENNISVISFFNKKKKTLFTKFDFFTGKDISFGGLFKSDAVIDFIDKPFDMLISYYDIQKPSLVLVTKKSRAKFKVGFSTIDKRFNHINIDQIAENHQIFINELFKYLKILNKI